MLHSRIRADEKMLLQAAQERGVDVELVDVRDLHLDVHDPPKLDVDGVLVRSLSLHRSLAAVRALERHGVPCVNDAATIRVCGDKVETSLRLAEEGVPTPRTRVAFTFEGAREALRALGGTAVVKPPVGSWGRLMARVEDEETLRAVVEHKRTLGGPQHGVLYVQELVDKPDRDVRAFVAGDEVLCAIERRNPDDWITNTARGATARALEVTPELADVCRRAADAVGGGVLALDLMERPDGAWTCHEVNHGMEFKNSVEPTGVDIPGRVVEHALEVMAS